VVRVGVEQRALAALHEARRRLSDVRRHMATLQAVYGFSMDDWARLQREKAALERFVRVKYGQLDLVDLALEDATTDDTLDDLDELDDQEDAAADVDLAATVVAQSLRSVDKPTA